MKKLPTTHVTPTKVGVQSSDLLDSGFRRNDEPEQLQKLLLSCIFLYQKLLRPFLRPSCRFYPSCSDYAKEALGTHGAFRGTCFSIRRLIKCHPFHPGGYDPVKPEGFQLWNQ